MKSEDRKLAMNQQISRRDVLHGVGAIAAASFVPGHAFDDYTELKTTWIEFD